MTTTEVLFESAAVTHPGRVRSANEDSHLRRDEAGIWVVADGMGGHQAGDLASRMLVDALKTVAPPHSAAELMSSCEATVVEVNDRILGIAAERGTTIGTTLVMLLSYGVHYACVWSGDSRIYMIRDGQIAMLSRDHTEVQELVDRGILTMEESRASPRRNVITRAIGVTPRAELEMNHGILQAGDVFLLCSDGLTNHVADDELQIYASYAAPATACDQLIELALERGGTDNVTVVIVLYRGPAEDADAARRSTDTVLDLSEGSAPRAYDGRDAS